MFISFIVGSLFLGGLVRALYKGRLPDHYKGYKVPKGPSCLPIIGNLKRVTDPQIHLLLEEWIKEYGSIIRFQMGQHPAFIITDANLINEIFVEKGELTNERMTFRNGYILFGKEGELFHTNGKEWSKKRKVFHKALTHLYRQNVISTITEEEADQLNQRIKEYRTEDGSYVFDPQILLSDTTFNIAHRLATGKKATPEETILLKSLLKFFSNPGLDELMPYVPGLYLFSKLIGWNNDQAFQSHIDSIFPTLVDYAKNPGSEFSIAHLLKDLDETDESRARLLLDVYLAGWDTIKYHISWFIALIANRPEIQKRLQNEFDQNDNDQKTYFNMVLKEVLRYRPLVLNSSLRIAKEDIITSNGYILPAGSLLMYDTWHVHHNEQYWKNPQVFDPERFRESTADESKNLIPFFTGIHTCPGNQSAKQQIFSIMKTLLRSYTFVPSTDEPIKEDTYHMYLMRQHPYQIKAIPR